MDNSKVISPIINTREVNNIFGRIYTKISIVLYLSR